MPSSISMWTQVTLARRRPFLVSSALLLLVSGTSPQSLGGQEDYDYHQSSAELVWRGMQALKTCNGLFVSNRTLDQIYRQELTGLRLEGPMSRDQVSIDYRRKAVSVGTGARDPLPAMPSAYREGLGCIVMAPDESFDTIDDLPELRLPAFPGDAASIPWPDGDRVEDRPLPADVDAAALEAAGDWAFGGHDGQVTLSLLVVHGGDIVFERYAPGFDMDTRTRTWSAAKSVAATVMGLAVAKGLLGLDDPLPIEWVPGEAENQAHDARRTITLRHLLHMSSGLYPVDNDRNLVNGSHLVYFGGWDGAYHPRDRGLLYEPGTVLDYENFDTLLGLYAVKQAIGDQQTYLEFPHLELFRKIGMRNTLPGVDRFGNYIMSSQIYTNARDLARFGLLYLNRGRWNGEQILPEEWVDFVRTPAPATRLSGNQRGGHFALVPDSRTDLPQDAFAASGAQGQFVVIVPSYDLVIVRRGLDWRQGSPGPGLGSWDTLAEVLKAFPARPGGSKLTESTNGGP